MERRRLYIHRRPCKQNDQKQQSAKKLETTSCKILIQNKADQEQIGPPELLMTVPMDVRGAPSMTLSIMVDAT
jgi:hypothetical protein